MNPERASKRVCIYCRNYQLVNKSSGDCQKLGVSVQGRWQACSLYLSPINEFSLAKSL